MSPAWRTPVSFGFIYTNGWSVFLVGHLIGISNKAWPQQNYWFSVPQIRAFPNLPHLNKWHLSNWCSGQNLFHVFSDPTWCLLARLIPDLTVNSFNSTSKTRLHSLLILAIAIIPVQVSAVFLLPLDQCLSFQLIFLPLLFPPLLLLLPHLQTFIHSVSIMGFLK